MKKTLISGRDDEMKIAEVEPTIKEFIKEYHTRGAEVLLLSLVIAMKEDDPFWDHGSSLVRLLIHEIRRIEENGNDQ